MISSICDPKIAKVSARRRAAEATATPARRRYGDRYLSSSAQGKTAVAGAASTVTAAAMRGLSLRARTCITGHDLTGRDLTGRDLTGRDLTGRDLTGRYLTGRDLT